MGEKRFFDRVHVLRTDVFDVFVLEHRGYRVQKHGGVAVWYYLHNTEIRDSLTLSFFYSIMFIGLNI